MTHRFRGILFWLLSFVSFSPLLAQVNVLTYHYENSRMGQNTNEVLLTPSNVNTNTFGKLFKYNVDGYVYAQPLYVSGMNIPGQGTRNVLFIATQHNSIYAVDADSTNGVGAGILWQVNLGTSAITPTLEIGSRYGLYTDITNEVGITGTPVIDLPSGTLYVDAFTHEGTNYYHRIHALNITNGTERPFGPVVVSATYPGVGVGSNGLGQVVFEAKRQCQRAGLTLAGGILYVAYSGYADTDPYHGWLIGYNATNLQPLANYVFNTTPNSTTNRFGTNAGEGGIWMSGNGLAVDSNTNLYFETGNGVFTATNGSGGTEYGDSFVKLSTTNGLAVIDYFTPWNQAAIGGGAADTDLGASGLLLLPDQPGPFPHLLLGGGKEGKVYLLNRDQFTTNNNHYNSTSTVDHVAQVLPVGKAGRMTATPAYWNGWVYFGGWSNSSGLITLRAFAMTNGLISTNPVSVSTLTNGFPGQTPTISANGTSNGILWGLKMANPGYLFAYNATNLTNFLYTSSQAAGNRDTLTNGVKFTVPIVANGKVYLGSQYSVYAFGLLGGNLAFSSPTYSVAETAGTATITVNRTGGSTGVVQVSYATVSGGTATSGVDYVDTSGTLNWADGDTAAKTFPVTIINDGLAETNETVNLVLSNSSGAYLGGQSSAVLTILKDAYQLWKFDHFGANANNNSIAGDLADPDGDRISNILEFALASDPNASGSEGAVSGSIVANHFQLHIRRNTSATNLTYVVQGGNTLGSWNDIMTYSTPAGWVANTVGATASESGVNGTAPDAYVNVTVTDPAVAGSGNRFFRLLVHR